jgi:hypothetical protein
LNSRVRVFFSARHYAELHRHLFPGDRGEHGAVVMAGLAQIGSETRLLVRDVVLAQDGRDYVINEEGYHSLKATFIGHLIRTCRDKRMVYLAVHNHGSDRNVSFSQIDLRSHERGYPALRDIADGMPVGALVLGRRSIEMDLWMPDGSRRNLTEAVVIGQSICHLFPEPQASLKSTNETYGRQLLMFGAAGQHILSQATVAVIGLGGIGSLVAEFLGRLGVGKLILVDPDRVEQTNLSRLVGATMQDAEAGTLKVEVAKRHIREASRTAQIVALASDATAPDVVETLKAVDFIFLAADTMRARLMVNGLVQQYFIPAVQLGAKVTAKSGGGTLDDAMSVARSLRPGDGCLLCSGCIDSTTLATEFLSDDERRAADYGTLVPNPSVISLNAVAAAHAVNDFLFDFLNLRNRPATRFLHMSHIHERNWIVTPAHSATCSECSATRSDSRFARGDAVQVVAMKSFATSRPRTA